MRPVGCEIGCPDIPEPTSKWYQRHCRRGVPRCDASLACLSLYQQVRRPLTSAPSLVAFCACGRRMNATSQRCVVCFNVSRSVAALRVCPDCGDPKTARARQCQRCKRRDAAANNAVRWRAEHPDGCDLGCPAVPVDSKKYMWRHRRHGVEPCAVAVESARRVYRMRQRERNKDPAYRMLHNEWKRAAKQRRKAKRQLEGTR